MILITIMGMVVLFIYVLLYIYSDYGSSLLPEVNIARMHSTKGMSNSLQMNRF